MEKQRNTQMLVIAVLAVAVLTMSVGFASFTQTLNINGNTTVSASSWNVKFATDTYAESSGSVTVDSADRTITGTSITYAVKLTKPGDFYEFTIDVKNSGTVNANLTGVTLSSLTAEQSKYLTYTLTYDSTPYSASASKLSVLLSANGGTVPVKVRVEYIQPTNPDDLPQSEVVVPLTASLSYEQAA